MRRVIYTLNQDGYLIDHVRESHQAAADRWGAEYVVLDEWPGTRKDTFGGKFQMYLLEGDEVCWLDGDVLVRDDCPSLFECLEFYEFVGVPCFQDSLCLSMDKRPYKVFRDSVESASEVFGYYPVIPPAAYINGGVLLWRKDVGERLFKRLDSTYPDRVINPMEEQTALNIALEMENVELYLARREYNRLGAATWELEDEMKCYVHHWANFDNYRGNKQEAMRKVQWKTSKS